MFIFKDFYIHWYSRSLAFAQQFVSNKADAENIVQDVFIRIYEKRQVFDEDMNMTAYLLTSIKNGCINYLNNKLRKKIQYIDDYPESVQDKICLKALEDFDTRFPDETSIEDRLNRAIEALPERCRKIFVMNKIEGKTHLQISKELDISENTIESQMTIAYRKLRIELKDCGLLLLFLLVSVN